MRLNVLNESLLQENLEKKRPYLAANLQKWLKNDGVNPTEEMINQVIDWIAQADPVCARSDGKKTPFVNQIFKWLSTNKIALPEDISTVSDVLEKYAKLPENQRKPLESYESPGQLRKELDIEQDKGPSSYADVAKVVATDGQFKMYQIDDFEQGKICFADSGWCVQNEEYFNEYKPPYFMVTHSANGGREKRYVLLHRDSYQAKDVQDDPLTLELAKPIEKLIKMVWPKYRLNGDLDGLMSLWPNAEDDIASDPKSSYNYANFVLHGPFQKGEQAIATNSHYALDYAHRVIKKRFPAGEKAIAQNAESAYLYASEVLRGRWPEAEKTIAQDPEEAWKYASRVIKGRWLEAEKTIIKDSESSHFYTKNVCHGDKSWLQHPGIE